MEDEKNKKMDELVDKILNKEISLDDLSPEELFELRVKLVEVQEELEDIKDICDSALES